LVPTLLYKQSYIIVSLIHVPIRQDIEKGEDKAKDRLLSYEIQNKMLQHNEQYIIVDKDIYRYNIAYEFLTLRISFKTEQIFSYFTQDIIDLIWGKYAERQNRIFLDIQSFFMKLYKGNERHPAIVISTHILPVLHLDDTLVIKPRHTYLILKADINLKYFRTIQRNSTQEISLQTIIALFAWLISYG